MIYNVYLQINESWKRIECKDLKEIINDIMKSEENINVIITYKKNEINNILISFNNKTGYNKVRRKIK